MCSANNSGALLDSRWLSEGYFSNYIFLIQLRSITSYTYLPGAFIRRVLGNQEMRAHNKTGKKLSQTEVDMYQNYM